MQLIKPSYHILDDLNQTAILQRLENAARTCYQSEDRITADGHSARNLVAHLRGLHHDAMLEFADLTVRFTVDRGVSHELVRHRLCSFAQESTRYCNYGNGHLKFVIPPWEPYQPAIVEIAAATIEEAMVTGTYWLGVMCMAEIAYKRQLEQGMQPQQARAVLPNSLATQIVIKANLREWQHIFALRTAPAAHPQMREIMMPLRQELIEKLPEIFAIQ